MMMKNPKWAQMEPLSGSLRAGLLPPALAMAQLYRGGEPGHCSPFFSLDPQCPEADWGETMVLWLYKAVAGSQFLQAALTNL